MSIGNILSEAKGQTPINIQRVEQKLLKGLNPEQREVVLHDKGPLLVAAVAGSGKTRSLVHRIGYLVAVRGVHPRPDRHLSFTGIRNPAERSAPLQPRRRRRLESR